ncbi:MAG TPA: hypothetical protein VMT68_08370 [Caulobacteraceae bacterium]|nr:hypothetical protein [Caulobacteraceae bacterium]
MAFTRSAATAAAPPLEPGAAAGRLAAHPYLVIGLAALAIWAPTLLIDFGRGDSLDENIAWSNQFSQLVAHGHLYPRWMPASFDGLGSPAFDYYPPLAFWTTALVSLGGRLAPMLALKLAALVALAASGVAMRLWLGRLCPPPRALLCAVIYMAAPYHLVDHYVRGAFAEFFALAVLPLAPLGLALAAERARSGPFVLAGGYALLLVAHLPMALLASVLLIGPYGLLLLWRLDGGRIRFALTAAAGLALGAGLAAPYLAPALGLEDAISAEYLWRLRPADHLFTRLGAWANPFEPLLAALSLIEALLAAGLAWMGRRAGPAGVFWGALATLVFAALSGLLPGFWSLPLMAKVQFAWRAMGVEEFALVTAIAVSPWADARRLTGLAAVLMLANPGLAADLKNLALGRPDAQLATPAELAAMVAQPRDVPEYLPHGMLLIRGGGEPAPRLPLSALAALPLAAPSLFANADPVTGAVKVRPRADPTPVVVRRFYHPSWRVTCDGRPVETGPAGPARLLSFTPPANAQECTASVGPTPLETLGDALAGASLVLLVGWAALMLRRARPSSATYDA